MKWLIKLFSKLSFKYKREVPAWELEHFRIHDFKGAIILTYTPRQISNWFIKGDWKHAAIVVGPDHQVEAVTKGVRKETIKHLLSGVKKYCVLLPTREVDTSVVVREAIEFSESDTEYDFNMKLGNSAYYCSELVVVCYNKANYGIHYGRLIHPSELFDKEHFKCVHTVEAK